MNSGVTAIALAVSTLLGQTPPQSQTPPSSATVAITPQEVAGHCPEDLASAVAVSKSAQFSSLGDAEKLKAYDALIKCMPRLSERGRLAAASLMVPGASPALWAMVIGGALAERDGERAVTALEAAAQASPETVRDLSDSLVNSLYYAGIGHPELRLRIAAALDRGDFRIHEPTVLEPRFNTDIGWMDLATARGAEGDVTGARRAIDRIHDGGLKLRVRVDRRLEGVLKADPTAFEPRRLAETALASDQAIAQTFPDRLSMIRLLSEDLRTLGRFDDAQRLLDDALRRETASEEKGAPAFTDPDQLNWLLNARARNLLDLGRVDEALSDMLRASKLAENGGHPNVSQTVNLAVFYNHLDRPKEALQELAVLDDGNHRASPVGMAIQACQRACAFAALGDQAKLKTQLDYLRAHPLDNPTGLFNALLCAGDLDALATEQIRLLSDPLGSGNALYELIEVNDPPWKSPRSAMLKARRESMIARPDVQAAIAKVGRREKVDLW